MDTIEQHMADYGQISESDIVTLDPAIKAQWVADLRSGKFPQTFGKLHDERGYCCLGVLCERAVEQGVVEAKERDISGGRFIVDYRDDDGITVNSSLPNAVIDWAGVKDVVGLGTTYGKLPFRTRNGSLAYLDDLNDYGLTFNQIADVIEFWY